MRGAVPETSTAMPSIGVRLCQARMGTVLLCPSPKGFAATHTLFAVAALEASAFRGLPWGRGALAESTRVSSARSVVVI